MKAQKISCCFKVLSAIFFLRLADWLTENGKTVHKFNFNAGDDYFYPPTQSHTVVFNDDYEAFPEFLQEYIVQHHIQAVVCFGDTRPYHVITKRIANENQASFWAFEEGYFRPYYITLEKDGVNAFSPLPRRADFFLEQFPKLAQQEYKAPTPVRGGFTPMAKNAIRYYIELFRNPRKYPDYIHHRAPNAGHYLKLWSLSILKRLNYYIEDIQIAKRVEAGKYGKFFIVPLQVFNDSQVRIHCDFPSVRSFLLHVLSSFAEHAPSDTNIIIKHHPMDRGFIDYWRDIKRFIKEHPELKGRVTYVHDVPLPVFLRHGLGMVTINSTSGLSGLIHNMRPLQKSPSTQQPKPKPKLPAVFCSQFPFFLPGYLISGIRPPFRQQQAHLACWPLSTGSNTSPSDGFAHSL